MKQYKYLMLHCSATPEGRILNGDFIRQVHMGPAEVPGGVIYKGVKYKSRKALPNESIGGKSIKLLTGRGWKQVGYSLLITHKEVEKLVDYDEDLWIQAGEITNGAAGMNSVTRHACYIGGLSADGKTPKDTRTEAQKWMMQEIIEMELSVNPKVLICGHNQFANKACPSFNTVDWLKSIKVPTANIYTK